MPVDLETETLTVAAEEFSDDLASEAARRWFSWSQEIFQAGGDEHDYEIFPIVKSAQKPERTSEGYHFVYPHEATVFFEKGTTHDEAIQATEAETLAFEWEDAPPEVRRMYEETFPLVFMPESHPDGIERIGGIEKGRQRTIRWMGRELR